MLLVRTRTELAKCFTLGNNKFTKIKSKIVIWMNTTWRLEINKFFQFFLLVEFTFVYAYPTQATYIQESGLMNMR